MRVLAVTPSYEPEGGGLERYAHAMLERMVRRGHEVEVLTCSRRDDLPHHVGPVAVSRVRPVLRLGNAPIAPQLAPRLNDAITSFAPSVVWAHTPVPFPAEVAAFVARRRGVPYAITYHAGQLTGSSRALSALAAVHRHTLERPMLAKAAALMAVSRFTADTALAAHRDRVSVVAPGVDGERFRPGSGQRGRDVLFVAPLSTRYRWKGLDTLLQAFATVREEFPSSRLDLVGAGDRVAELSRARHEGVRLRGRLGEDALLDAYQRAAVTVLPSTSNAEAFGMVLAEANACACPVVGSAIGGIPDFVRPGVNGLLAAPGDAKDLAGRLIEVLSDPHRAAQLGAEGRKLVLRDHDWDGLTTAAERVLERIAQKA